MKRAKQASPAQVTSLGSRLDAISSARVGFVAGVSPEGRPLVDFEGSRSGPLPAASLVKAPARTWRAAAARRQPALILFDGGDPLRPVLVGLVADPDPEAPALAEGALPSMPQVAVVDGRRVAIEGHDEIVLRCGEASITLRRNGKVVIRGTFLDSHSSGTNRVKGGSVRIN
jgi:hypothetical protein